MNNNEQLILANFKAISESNSKIGILVSGGIDSGLALFLLLKTITDNRLDREIHACTVTKTPDAVENAIKIISLISNKFSIPVKHHVVDSHFDSSEHTRHTAAGAIFLLNFVDIVISATNAIVSERILDDRDNPHRVSKTDPRVARPFLEYTKDVTISLAIKYELIDLLANSHSCIKQSYSRCGSCYWCKEREWGFRKNNYQDPGTL